jgi:ubiquinone/menaquinone biosynthesis C-methylase UbiE
MTDLSYRQFDGSAAENYERYFLPAIGTPVAGGLLSAADLQLGERVLDVGCGTGLIARLAAEAVGTDGSVTGVDISPEMIGLASSLPQPEGAHVDWRQGDATALPFADGGFDVVVCQLALMFVEDRPGAIGEMHRVLAEGGRVVISTAGPIQPAFELMEQAIVDHISTDLAGFVRMVFSMHDPDTHIALLQDAGFGAVESRIYTVELHLPSPAEFLWQYINLPPLGPFVADAPEAA